MALEYHIYGASAGGFKRVVDQVVSYHLALKPVLAGVDLAQTSTVRYASDHADVTSQIFREEGELQVAACVVSYDHVCTVRVSLVEGYRQRIRSLCAAVGELLTQTSGALAFLFAYDRALLVRCEHRLLAAGSVGREPGFWDVDGRATRLPVQPEYVRHLSVRRKGEDY